MKNPDPIERARKPRGSLLFWSLNDEERRKKNVIDTDYDKILTIIDRLNQNAKNIIGTVQTKKFIINISILVIFELNKIRKNIETLQNTKNIKIDVPCKNCNIWNHIDAKTKYNSVCQKFDIDNPYTFTGKWEQKSDKNDFISIMNDMNEF